MINRCVCTKQSFVDLLAIADEHGLCFDGLQERTECGSKCGLCIPFIRAVVDRRQTEFRLSDLEVREDNAPSHR